MGYIVIRHPKDHGLFDTSRRAASPVRVIDPITGEVVKEIKPKHIWVNRKGKRVNTLWAMNKVSECRKY